MSCFKASCLSLIVNLLHSKNFDGLILNFHPCSRDSASKRRTNISNLVPTTPPRCFTLLVLGCHGLKMQQTLDYITLGAVLAQWWEHSPCQVWAALPTYLSDLLEQVQRKVPYIVFPDRCYSDALHLADLELLSDRRRQACMNFATNCHVSGTLSSLFRVPMVYYHGYNLRSGSQSYHASTGNW